MHSSYAANRYDEVFRAIVRSVRPVVAVELGVLEGYSTCAIGQGLQENHQCRQVRGSLNAYDLFERYPFRKAPLPVAWANVQAAGVEEFVALHPADAFTVHEQYAPLSVNLLHVDLSNTGEVLRRIMAQWDPKLAIGGVVLFEGGSAERDRVPWMLQYDGEPIRPELERNVIIAEKYVFGTYLPFPSLTCLLKKRG